MPTTELCQCDTECRRLDPSKYNVIVGRYSHIILYLSLRFSDQGKQEYNSQLFRQRTIHLPGTFGIWILG